MLRQLNVHNQIVIPKQLIAKLNVRAKDYLDATMQDGAIILRPVSIETPYKQEELRQLEKAFSPKNRGKKLSAGQFKKHLEKL